jgi:hypothetical protein
VRIPVNVTADSGNVTGNSGERDRGSVLRGLILCRLFFFGCFPFPVLDCFSIHGPCQAAGGPPHFLIEVD